MRLLNMPLAAAILAAFSFTSSFAMAQTTDYLFDGINLEITDNDAGGVTDVQNIFGIGTITDVDVDLHIEHTWQGDLIINLSHDGTTVPLLFRAGSSDGGGLGFSEDNLGTDLNRFVLDDEASSAYDLASGWGDGSVTGTGIADVGGSWIPYGQFSSGGIGGLNAFDGMSDSGDWTLFISDNEGGDLGTLVSWSLHITTVPEPSTAIVLLMGMSGLVFVRRRR